MEPLVNNHQHEEAIEKWMLAVLENDGVHRFDDLHIDAIDPAWRPPDRWLDGGLEPLRVATVVRRRNRFPFSVALAFSLKSSSQPLGADFSTWNEFRERIDWSPPSLYFLDPDKEAKGPLALGGTVKDLDPAIFNILGKGLSCYYQEFPSQEKDEYFRSVVIESKGIDFSE